VPLEDRGKRCAKIIERIFEKMKEAELYIQRSLLIHAMTASAISNNNATIATTTITTTTAAAAAVAGGVPIVVTNTNNYRT